MSLFGCASDKQYLDELYNGKHYFNLSRNGEFLGSFYTVRGFNELNDYFKSAYGVNHGFTFEFVPLGPDYLLETASDFDFSPYTVGYWD